MRERMLVNFFYAQPVGHAIEALHYAAGHHAADPEREVAVALNAATPVELVDWAPFVSAGYAVEHPFLEPYPEPGEQVISLPHEWDYVVDDGRRYQPFQTEMFPGMRDYYLATDRLLTVHTRRSYAGDPRVGYVPHTPLRLELPPDARRKAEHDGETIALMPAGSSAPETYPGTAAWLDVMDALSDARPGLRFVLVGRLARDERTSSSLDEAAKEALLGHRSNPVDAFDQPLAEQLAAVEAAGAFLSPHTGFGMAALAVGTPWLSLAGGRWFEYFFNHVPFRSIVPDVTRYPSYSTFDTLPVTEDEDGERRTPSMTRARVREDLGRIVTAAEELLDERVDYETALADYFRDLVAAHAGDASGIFSIDGVHERYTS